MHYATYFMALVKGKKISVNRSNLLLQTH